MKESYRFYRGCYRFARFLFGIFYRIEVSGQENIPEGSAIICANHSSVADPIFLAFAFGIEHFLHVVAKVEIFKIPVLSSIVRGLGAISVDRDISDIGTIRSMLSYLKNGKPVSIFKPQTHEFGSLSKYISIEEYKIYG